MTRVGLTPLAAYGLLALIVLFWGANWPIMKIGLVFIPPFYFAFARLLLGALTLFLVLAFSRRLRVPPRRDLPVLVSVGLLQMAGFLSLVNLGLLHVDAGRSAVLAYTTPLWVTPGAAILLGERLTPARGAGLAFGLAGLAALFNPLGFDWSDPEILYGNLLLMLAALAWAAAILHVKLHRWASTPLQMAPWQMLLGAPVLLCLGLMFEDPGQIEVSADLAAVLLYNGPIATAFCFWAAVTVTRSLPAVSTSLGFLGVPVAGVLFSVLWLSEILTVSLLGGLLLICLGVGLVSLSEARSGKAGAGQAEGRQ